MSRQTLCGTTHDDGDAIPRAFPQDVGAGLLGYRADAQGEQDVAVERNLEIGSCW